MDSVQHLVSTNISQEEERRKILATVRRLDDTQIPIIKRALELVRPMASFEPLIIGWSGPLLSRFYQTLSTKDTTEKIGRQYLLFLGLLASMTSDTHTIDFIHNLLECELTAIKTCTLPEPSAPLGLDITTDEGKQVLETIRKINLAQKAVY
jgi:hypothetical protein